MSDAGVPTFLVATDLDGTLLDHHNYSWSAAEPAIRYLQKHQIPIIFNTSKTLDEALALQQATGIFGPVIIENGSALALDEDNAEQLLLHQIDDHFDYHENLRIYTFGQRRTAVLEFIEGFRKRHGQLLQGYNDWPLETVVKKTGLPEHEALLSRKKMFSEPFKWLGDDKTLALFMKEAELHAFNVLKGGRFYHLLGKTDKASPLIWLQQRLAALSDNQPPKLICLGDNDNDIQMLNVADYPVCVKSPTSAYPAIRENPHAIYTQGMGPEGWAEAIASIFADFTN